MPLDLPRRARTVGALRAGVVTEGRRQDGSRFTRPRSLEVWRATSADRELVEAIAAQYGGSVQPWQPHGRTVESWSVTTETDRLEVVIPPVGALEQWWETYGAGGLERRCDGKVQASTLVECACPADPARRRELAAKGRACRPTSRLSVLLAAMPAVGAWRLTTTSVYAAMELPGPVELLARAAAAGELVVATLRLDRREKRVTGQPTSIYTVPVIDVPPTAIPALTSGVSRGTIRALPAGDLVDVEPDPEAIAAAAVALHPGIRNLAALTPAARDRVVDEARRLVAAGGR